MNLDDLIVLSSQALSIFWLIIAVFFSMAHCCPGTRHFFAFAICRPAPFSENFHPQSPGDERGACARPEDLGGAALNEARRKREIMK